jgi:hypothetical protein
MQKGMDLSKANLKDVLQKQQQTLQAVSTYLSELEEKLNSVGDDAQLANVDGRMRRKNNSRPCKSYQIYPRCSTTPRWRSSVLSVAINLRNFVSADFS